MPKPRVDAAGGQQGEEGVLARALNEQHSLIDIPHEPIIPESRSASIGGHEMKRETNVVQPPGKKARGVDAFDRKILSALVRDATASYADIARKIGKVPGFRGNDHI